MTKKSTTSLQRAEIDHEVKSAMSKGDSIADISRSTGISWGSTKRSVGRINRANTIGASEEWAWVENATIEISAMALFCDRIVESIKKGIIVQSDDEVVSKCKKTITKSAQKIRQLARSLDLINR